MKKVEEYRARATECTDMANRVTNPEIREHYRRLADTWNRLAEERLTFLVRNDEATEAKEPSECARKASDTRAHSQDLARIWEKVAAVGKSPRKSRD